MSKTAFTMVQNDMVILELWLSYYSKFFDKILILGNGTKEEYNEQLRTYKEKYKADFVRCTEFLKNSQETLRCVTGWMADLLKQNDWVLYSDCDEFLVPDLNKYTDLGDFISREDQKKKSRKVIYAEGFEIIQVEAEQPIDYSCPYLSQRNYWFKDPAYNKPLLMKKLINWVDGFHKEFGMTDEESRGWTETGLYLLHLKYADMVPAGKRDIGPMITFTDPNYLTAGYAQPKELIPQWIKGAF